MNPNEREILLCAIESRLDPRHYSRIKELVGKVDPNHLLETAIREGLGSLLYKGLVSSGAIESLSEGQRNRLESHYYGTIRFNLKLINALRDVLSRFRARGIRPLLLQGICLLENPYGDVGLRPMSDIDLLVFPEQYMQVTSILKDQGYERDAVYPNTFRKGSISLDLHTQIMWADRIHARRLLLGREEERILQRAAVTRFEDQEALRLNACDEVFYLGLHALKHRVNRLIWLVDIRYLVAGWGEPEWKLLFTRADELGLRKVLFIILSLLCRALDFYPPGPLRDFMKKNRLHFFERLALERRVKKDSLPLWAPLVLFSPREDYWGRFSFVVETLFPRSEILRQIFTTSPDLKSWQLYWKRFVQLFSRIISRKY
ncbi:MAG: nucleotidyltransferase family protein [Deltaproteobacteria bacterium]|nr:nucleotidyltransferase family protein [Deltaproteobacteria bacterium]MBW1977439.1 nucleotidyltransferase family protein [Deltaproteobacteria bacterium]MBW2299650.1 nucleotidyltransferase family protein [Deltaproteobacteria bacterium]